MPHSNPLALTGERTAPGHALEQYWFARHEVAYEWSANLIRQTVQTAATPDSANELVIVDAGCGEGYGAHLLGAELDAEVLGLELDESAAAHARARYGDTITILEANLDNWPTAAASADVVVSMQVVEHLWNLPKFWSEALRTLKPGGLLIITTPNRLTFSPGLARGAKPTNPFHVEEFDMQQLAESIEQAGFTAISCQGLHHAPSLQAWESAHGDLVELQVKAALAAESTGATWPSELAAKVASISNSDFEINATDPETCADLVITARKAADV